MYISLWEILAKSNLKGENTGFINSALLWQKEASDIPSKSELWMFSYFT